MGNSLTILGRKFLETLSGGTQIQHENPGTSSDSPKHEIVKVLLFSGLRQTSGYATSYVYDGSGRLSAVQNARGYLTTNVYDARDLVARVTPCAPEAASARVWVWEEHGV